jgi:hypothetical protein
MTVAHGELCPYEAHSERMAHKIEPYQQRGKLLDGDNAQAFKRAQTPPGG